MRGAAEASILRVALGAAALLRDFGRADFGAAVPYLENTGFYVFMPCFSVSVFCGFKEGLQKENVLFSMFFPDAFTKKVGIDKF